MKMSVHVIQQVRIDSRSSHQIAHGQVFFACHHVQSSALLEQVCILGILLYLCRECPYGHLYQFLFHFSLPYYIYARECAVGMRSDLVQSLADIVEDILHILDAH